MQDCSISIADALEIQQSCTKPSMWSGEAFCHFAEDIFETNDIEIKIAHVDSILPKLDLGGPINNKSTLFEVITLRHNGDKPLPKPMMI